MKLKFSSSLRENAVSSQCILLVLHFWKESLHHICEENFQQVQFYSKQKKKKKKKNVGVRPVIRDPVLDGLF